jgi:Gnt-I system high-affinity gluconate transporter
MSLLIAALGIIVLLILIIVFKVNAFIAFIIVSILLGITEGMPVGKVVASIQQGIGDTMGSLVMILGFGAMLGKLVADSGAAQRITTNLVNLFGLKNIQWALMLTGFIVGIPMFFYIGFVVLIPLVFTIAASTGLSLLYVGIPMIASLSVTHGLLPPHPAPTAIAEMFGADIGKTLIYGILISIPTIVISGPLFSKAIRKVKASPIKEFVNPKILRDDEMPGLGSSIFTTLLPVILIGISSLSTLIFPEGDIIRTILGFVGDPVIAMLISLLVAVFLFGIALGKKIGDVMDSLGHSVGSITMALLIVAGAGGFKQVLIASGISNHIADLLTNSNLSPLLLAWIISAILRICIGSATVAGLTTAGLILPLATNGMVNKELMVLSIGAGSLILSHVNDGAFWIFKEYFNLSVKDTLATWTVMETIISITGLFCILLLNLFL